MSTNEAIVGRTYEEFGRKYEAEQVLSLNRHPPAGEELLAGGVLVVIMCGRLTSGVSLA